MVKQLQLPYVISEKLYKKIMKTMIRLKTMTLYEGYEYLAKQGPRKIDGNWVEDVAKPSATRLKMFASGQIACVACGIRGDHFHIERHKNDKVMPFSVNLYGWRGDKEILMTWDHVLPKSLGGSNRLENAQCMCTECNGEKGNKLSITEIVDIVTRKDAVLMYRDIPSTAKTLRDTISQVQAEFDKVSKALQNEPNLV